MSSKKFNIFMGAKIGKKKGFVLYWFYNLREK